MSLNLKKLRYDAFVFQSRRKRARTPTPGHYLGLKSTRDYGKLNKTLLSRHIYSHFLLRLPFFLLSIEMIYIYVMLSGFRGMLTIIH